MAKSMFHFHRLAALVLCLGLGALQAQTQQIASISSTYPLNTTMLGSGVFYSISVGVSYPVGLSPSQYIPGAQLNADFQTFSTAYPNQQDPVEAILSTILSQILKKYPQMTGGTASALLAASIAPGVSTPSGGAVTVVIGTYGAGSTYLGGASPATSVKPVVVR